jgi:hypothetical protein
MAFSDRQGEVARKQLRARDKNPTIKLDGSENDENGCVKIGRRFCDVL